jgi:hypothetical protein
MIARKDTKFVSTERYQTSLRSKVHRAVMIILGVGNVASAAFAFAMPKRAAELIDEPEDAVKRIAQKDLAAGMALLASRGQPVVPLALKAAEDARLGIGWLKTKPLIALIPLASAALAVVAILTRDQGEAS